MIKSSSKIKRTISLLIIISITMLSFTESFRVHETIMLPVNVTGIPETAKPGINDAIILLLPEDRTFLAGVELAIKVPKTVSAWHDSVAWSFYEDITPEPKESVIDYSGTRATSPGTFNSLSINIKFPLIENSQIKETPYSKLLKIIPQEKNGKIFFRLQIAMKGVPEEIGTEHFEITAKPILNNKGRLLLSVLPPTNSNIQTFNTFIDGNTTKIDNKGFILDAGIHTVNITSDYYRNEVRTITVEQAKTTNLEIVLRDIAPSIRIAAPDGTKIFFDETEMNNNNDPFSINQGVHTIKFVIGDYEVTKTVTAVNGRSYTVSVSLDAFISESE